MLRTGQRNRLISIQAASNTKSDSGDVVKTWSEVAKVWAQRVDMSGRELEAAMALHAEVSVRFGIRYRPDIQSGMRVELGGQFFQVLAPLDKDGRRVDLYLYCATGLLDG
jgi:SPP1 family predicted phage head-tail adaptor